MDLLTIPGMMGSGTNELRGMMLNQPDPPKGSQENPFQRGDVFFTRKSGDIRVWRVTEGGKPVELVEPDGE